MTALKQMGDNDLKEMGIPMVFLVLDLCSKYAWLNFCISYFSFTFLLTLYKLSHPARLFLYEC